MRKILGIGETVYDILFRNGKPIDAVPGGSVFNGLVSLGRAGLECTFITEVGSDQVGNDILAFMKENGITCDYVSRYEGKKTAISLAYLNENNDARYSFYKDYPNNRLDFDMPQIAHNDIVAFGAYFALNKALRGKVLPFLKHAREHGAILYYDLNFRDNHLHEVDALRDTFKENFGLAHIVRGSHEDFKNLFGFDDGQAIYREVSPYCSRLICTRGKDGVEVFDHGTRYFFESNAITPVSTIGAGDNFNAGILYGLIREGILLENIETVPFEVWSKLVRYGIEFGTQACLTTANYVDKEFAMRYRIE